MRSPVTKISITLPENLLQQVDRLTEKDYANRSDLIRQALQEFMKEHGKMGNTGQNGKLEPTLKPEFIDRMRKEFTYVQPNDLELLQFLTYYRYTQENQV